MPKMQNLISIAFIFVASQVALTVAFAPRMIGGSPVDISAHPYQLSLRIQKVHQCGASIINPLWALTTATCVDHNPEPSIIELQGGSTNVYDDNAFVTAVSEYHYHSEFDRVTHAFDVAVLKVVDPFLDATLIPIRLAVASADLPDTSMVSFAGWGKNEVIVFMFFLQLVAYESDLFSCRMERK